MKPIYDICIVGGGVTGACLASYLGKSALKVAVIERNLNEKDRIVGELLQPGGVEMLEKMGLEHLLDGFDAQSVDGYALFMKGESFEIGYPEKDGKRYAGRGFRNGKFVQKLRAYMQAQKNVTVIEGTVNELLETDKRIVGVSYTTPRAVEAKEITATLTIVCDGIFSTFRNTLSVPNKSVTGFFLGLILKDCQLPYPNHGHVIIAESSPILMYPVSSTETRILVDFRGIKVPPKREELQNYLTSSIAPQLPSSVQSSFLKSVEEGKFKLMPNHRMAANPNLKQGAVLIGDSLNMRHPLTGGGMTVAFSDVYLLGSLLMKMKNPKRGTQWERVVRQFYESRNQQTATINILADALYGVMGNKELKEACFNYLKRSGSYSQEPITILSAISRDSNLLIKHFFAVALFGIKGILMPIPTVTKAKRSLSLLSNSVRIIYPLLRNEKMLRLQNLRQFIVKY